MIFVNFANYIRNINFIKLVKNSEYLIFILNILTNLISGTYKIVLTGSITRK